MAVVSKAELTEMVNRIIPRTRKEQATPADERAADVRQTLREQAQAQLKKLGM